jgi:sodium transport system permease protein
VLRTEWRLHFRDKRALAAALLLPVLGPALFGGMFSALASWRNTEAPLVLQVEGAERAPSLVAFFERAGARVEAAPADAEARVRDGKLDVVLRIPEGYGEDFRRGRPARVEVLADPSRNQARTPLLRTRALLEAYAQTIASQRLLARGVSPTLAQPLEVQELDFSTPERNAATLLATIPLFLIMAAFAGGMSVAIDTTAGERERASLEPLLLNPVHRLSLITGKWLSTSTVTMLAVTLTLLGFALVVRRVPLEDLGVKVLLGPSEVAVLLAVLAPLALLAAAVEMLVSTFARSFKEAQTYLTLVLFLPMVPSMAMTFRPVNTQGWMYAVPSLSQNLLVNEVLRGEGVTALGVAAAAASALLLAAAALVANARLLGRERIVFGR